MLDGSKKAVKSGTILGSIIAMIPGADMLQNLVLSDGLMLNPHVQAGMIIGGTLYAIYRRIKAEHTIEGVL